MNKYKHQKFPENPYNGQEKTLYYKTADQLDRLIREAEEKGWIPIAYSDGKLYTIYE